MERREHMARRPLAQGGGEVSSALRVFPGTAGEQQNPPLHVFVALRSQASPWGLSRAYSRVRTRAWRAEPLGWPLALALSSWLQGSTQQWTDCPRSTGVMQPHG